MYGIHDDQSKGGAIRFQETVKGRRIAGVPTIGQSDTFRLPGGSRSFDDHPRRSFL